MSPHIITKILSVVSLAALVVMPIQETAHARSMGGGGNTSNNTVGVYQTIWNGPLYNQALDKGHGIGGGGSTNGSRGIAGGGSTSGSRGINGGNSNSSYGSSLIPGGYQYDAARGIGGGSSNGGRGIVGGGSTSGSRGISGGNSGNGSSLIAGGYQYDPSRGINGGGSSNGGRGIAGGGSTSGSRGISGGSSSSGNGSSLIPGGYQYDPSRGINGGGSSSGGREIAGGGSSTGGREITGGGSSTGGREITGGGSSTGGREITGGGTASACGYGSSLIPGGYQYCPGTEDDNDNDNNNNDDDDVTPVEETKYYACEDDDDDVIYMKVSQNGNDYTIRLYEEGKKNGYFISRDMDGEEVAEFIADKQEDYDCSRISRSEFEDGLEDDDDDDNDRDRSTCNDREYPEDIDGHWSEIYVRRLYDLCVTEGYNDGSFRPNQNVTRAELVKMGLYANGLEPNDGCYDYDCGSPYSDLDEWQGPWVRTAYDHEIVEGYANDKFRPNQYITRAEAVKVVLATYGYRPLSVNKSFFNDVSGWSTGWIEQARVIGMVQGIGNGNFDPNRPITRAEAAKIIVKMIEHWDTEIQ